MKKGIAMLLAGLSLMGTPVAGAEAVKVTGEVTVKYERDTAQGEPAVAGTMSTLKLSADAELSPALSLFTRFAAQRASQPALADFNTAAYAANTKTVAALDQFGLIYKADKLDYKLGRQELTIGTEALLYKRNNERVGRHSLVDGLTVSGQAGMIEVSAVVVVEDNEPGNPGGKVYAVRSGYSPTEKLGWGLTLGRYQNTSLGSANHWAADGKYEFGKHRITAQYTESSQRTNNKGYVANWTYGFDGLTSVCLTGFRMEAAGAIGGQSEFASGNKGFYYGLSHKLSEAASLDCVYKDQRQLSDGKKNAKFETVMRYTF